MIKTNKELNVPHGNSTIWRYMGLDKFIDLVTTNDLYFANASTMTDKYEGVVPRKTLKSKRKRLESLGKEQKDIDQTISIFNAQYSSLKELTLINCWSINPSESYALWKIYLAGSKSGVAIKTNVSKLKKSIKLGNDKYDEDIYLGEVKYSDFIPDRDLNRMKLVTTKNTFYEFEKELRLFIFHYPLSEGGVTPPYNLSYGRRVKVDMETLIDKIYLSPFAGAWFEETFKNLIEKLCPSLLNKIIVSDVQDQ